MVWRFAVFVLCSYWQSGCCWGRFRSPAAGVLVGGPAVVLGDRSTGTIKGGVAEKGPVLTRIGGRVFPHILPSPLRTWGAGKQGGGFSASRV